MIRNHRFELTVILLAALLSSILCLWKIHEFDVFLYIHFGRELLHGHTISNDKWTYTIYGQHWIPPQWLIYIPIALIDKMGGFTALCLFRSFLIFSFVSGLGYISFLQSKRREVRVVNILLLPVITLLICQWRIFITAEFITTIEFIILIAISLLPLKVNRRILFSLLVLLIWSNSHGGTYPIGAMYFTLVIFSEQSMSWKKKFGLAALSGIIWFLTPNGLTILSAFIDNFLNYGKRLAIYDNPDFEHLTFSHFYFRYRAWSYQLWLIFNILAFAGFILSFLGKLTFDKGPYKSRLFCAAVWILLTLATVQFARTIVYQVVFIFPIVAQVSGAGFEWFFRHSEKTRWAGRLLYTTLLCFVAFRLVPDNLIRFVAYERGTGIDGALLPIKAVQFIKENHLQGQIFNHIDVGGLLHYEMPDTPLFIDGRDIPFLALIKEWQEALHGDYASFLERYKVNTVIDKFQYNENVYPHQTWALVFIDNDTVVYIRRVALHLNLISQKEYKFLIPLLRADLSKISLESKEIVELERCLKESEYTFFCGNLLSMQLARSGHFDQAAEIVERLAKKNPWDRGLQLRAADLEMRLGNRTKAAHLLSWANQLD